jgi:hypothetical protein
LFGRNEGTVRNIGLIVVDISGRNYVGGLAGANIKIIEYAYTTGKVVGNGDYIGGITGRNVTSNAQINYSYSSAAVEGGYNVGGLAGSVDGSAIVKNSYASFTKIPDGNSSTTGGLAGRFDSATIDNVGGVCNYNKGDKRSCSVANSQIIRNLWSENDWVKDDVTGYITDQLLSPRLVE